MTRRCKLRADFTDAVTEVLLTRGLPEDIIQLILGTRDYAADTIRRAALDMHSPARDVRMAIRWFLMTDRGLQEPFVVRSGGWHWVNPTAGENLTPLNELIMHTDWHIAGRPVPPYRHALHTGAHTDAGTPSVFRSVMSRNAHTMLLPGALVIFVQ